MPCDSGPAGPSYADTQHPRLVSLLCYILTRYRRGDPYQAAANDNPDLVAWWKEHEEHDMKRLEAEAKREDAERKRREALAKLTPEERAILRLNDSFR